MKKILLAAFLITGSASLCNNTASAQVSVHINVGSQPIWGPTGYDYASYYYLPDVDAYYDINAQLFYYQYRGGWESAPYLPGRYRNYDLYNGYKVVINEPRPWMHADRYRRQYSGYRGRHGQPFIRDSRDERYYANPNHPMHNQWHGGDANGYHGDRHDDHSRGGDDRGHNGYNGRQQNGGNNGNNGGNTGGNRHGFNSGSGGVNNGTTGGSNNGGQHGTNTGNGQNNGNTGGQNHGTGNGGSTGGQQHGTTGGSTMGQGGAVNSGGLQQQGGSHSGNGQHSGGTGGQQQGGQSGDNGQHTGGTSGQQGDNTNGGGRR